MELNEQIEQAEMQDYYNPAGDPEIRYIFTESELKSLLETGIEDAIWDYLHDKSDKAHINTLGDWVEDYFQGLELFNNK